MAGSAVLLSQETFDRIMTVVEGWEEGELPLILGDGLKLDEQGPTGMKISATATNGGNSTLTVSDGTNTVTGVTRMNYLGTLFSVTSGGTNIANINLKTETC